MGIISKGIVDGDLSHIASVDGNITDLSTVDGSITYGNGIGTKDYNKLINKPQIESVTLIGDKTFEELGLCGLDTSEILSILV